MRHVMTLAFLIFTTPVFAQDAPTISVVGNGEITVAPDVAVLNIGVAQQAETAADAMKQMSADMRGVIERLAALGIAQNDMQTSGLRLDIVQDYTRDGQPPRVIGYRAHNSVNITVRNLDDLGGLLDAVVSDGANQLSSLQFDLAERGPHLTKAREAAVNDARDKAQTFATAADASLGAVQSIQEVQQGVQPFPMIEARSMAQDGGVPIAPGEIDISAQVLITYALIP